VQGVWGWRIRGPPPSPLTFQQPATQRAAHTDSPASVSRVTAAPHCHVAVHALSGEGVQRSPASFWMRLYSFQTRRAACPLAPRGVGGAGLPPWTPWGCWVLLKCSNARISRTTRRCLDVMSDPSIDAFCLLGAACPRLGCPNLSRAPPCRTVAAGLGSPVANVSYLRPSACASWRAVGLLGAGERALAPRRNKALSRRCNADTWSILHLAMTAPPAAVTPQLSAAAAQLSVPVVSAGARSAGPSAACMQLRRAHSFARHARLACCGLLAAARALATAGDHWAGGTCIVAMHAG